MNPLRLKASILFALALNLSGCIDLSSAKQIGDSNLCIPKSFMIDLSSSFTSDSDLYDESPAIYEGVYIEAPYIQQDIPEYQVTFVQGDYRRKAPLSITITQYQPYKGSIPYTSEYDHFFSKANPNLVGYRNEWPYVHWSAFEIQPDQSREYWGECDHYSGELIDCYHDLKIGEFRFSYSIYGPNIDLYPQIDAYLKKKVAKEWRCDS